MIISLQSTVYATLFSLVNQYLSSLMGKKVIVITCLFRSSLGSDKYFFLKLRFWKLTGFHSRGVNAGLL